jgi:hypothetical protein
MVQEHIMDHLLDEMKFMVNPGDSDNESSICSESDDDEWQLHAFLMS